MTDNVTISQGLGTTVASDDVGGVQVQRVKVTWGADGVANDANATTPLPVDTELPAAGASADTLANPTTVVVGSVGYVYNGTTWDRRRDANTANGASGTGLAGAGALIYDGTNWRRVVTGSSLADGGTGNGSVTVHQVVYNGTTFDRLRGDATNGAWVNVKALPALPTGSNAIGTVGVTTLPALPTGSNNIGNVGVASLPALPTGSNTIGNVGVASVGATADPHSVSTWNVTTSADNALATVTKAASVGANHFITSIVASYSGSKTGLLTLTDGSTGVWQHYVYNSFSITFSKPLKLSTNSNAILTLVASGTGGTLGTVTLSGYTI